MEKSRENAEGTALGRTEELWLIEHYGFKMMYTGDDSGYWLCKRIPHHILRNCVIEIDRKIMVSIQAPDDTKRSSTEILEERYSRENLAKIVKWLRPSLIKEKPSHYEDKRKFGRLD